MRIVLTAHQFLPDHTSGTEIIAYGIAKELRARGHEVTVVTGHPDKESGEIGPSFDEYEYDSIPVVRFHRARVPMGAREDAVQREYDNRPFRDLFGDWLRRHQPDLVHFIHLGRLSSSAISACVAAGVPTVFTATDFWLVCPTNQLRLPDNSLCNGPTLGSANCVKHVALVSRVPEMRDRAANLPVWLIALGVWAARRGLLGSSWYARNVRSLSARPNFLRAQARLLGGIVVPSRVMRDRLVASGIPGEKMVTIPYGIDLRHIRRDCGRGNLPKLRVTFVGTLAEHKGAHVVITAVRSIARDVPVELKLHGRTDEYPEYVERLRALIADDDRIELRGPFDNRDIGRVLDEADLLVCPSLWYENTPLVIYEAMAAGVPVIATDLPGMSESIEHDVNGLLFARNDSAALAAQLKMLAGDRAHLRRLAEATRPPISVAEHVTRLESLYEALTTAKP